MNVFLTALVMDSKGAKSKIRFWFKYPNIVKEQKEAKLPHSACYEGMSGGSEGVSELDLEME